MTDAEARQAHARLVRLLRENRLRLGVNIGPMNRPRSPVFRRIETALPILLGIMGVVIAGAIGGFPLGLAALVAGLGVWFLVVPPRVKDQGYDRTLGYGTAEAENFVLAWEARAVRLQRGSEECRPPGGDWAAFVRETRTQKEQDREDGLA